MDKNLVCRSLKQSGLCIDNIKLLDWIVKRSWAQTIAFKFLRIRFSPDILQDAKNKSQDIEEQSRLFSLGISYINVRGTYKTTGYARNQKADKILQEKAMEFSKPVLLDVGSSDGLSSLNLIRSGYLHRVLLTDRFNRFYKRDFLGKSIS